MVDYKPCLTSALLQKGHVRTPVWVCQDLSMHSELGAQHWPCTSALLVPARTQDWEHQAQVCCKGLWGAPAIN